jgi:hypothetical protein
MIANVIVSLIYWLDLNHTDPFIFAQIFSDRFLPCAAVNYQYQKQNKCSEQYILPAISIAFAELVLAPDGGLLWGTRQFARHYQQIVRQRVPRVDTQPLRNPP